MTGDIAADDKDKCDPLCVSLMCLSVVGVMGTEGPQHTSSLRNSHNVGCTQDFGEKRVVRDICVALDL